MVQTLPLMQYLELDGIDWEFLCGFPVSIGTSCSQLETLQILGGQLGPIPAELGRLTALTQL